MSLIKGILTFLITLISLSNFCQIDRGDLIVNESPQEIDSFFINGQIDIGVLRKTTSFLTNRNINYYEGYPIPRRKKAFMRHVKHVSEKLERHYYDGQLKNADISEMVYELYLLEASLKQKTVSRSKVSWKEKVSMVKETSRSKRVFRYCVQTNESNKIDSLPYLIPDSPFYHQLKDSMPMHKQFAYLARKKKIDAKENMVLLFKSIGSGGSAPKIDTDDLDLDNQWVLKWGDEVHTDIVGSRIFAALGYDVDHPYFYGKEELTLVFDDYTKITNAKELVDSVYKMYQVDISLFISSQGKVSSKMAKKNSQLDPFIGKQYVRFLKCSIEARPDRVKRIGSFLPYSEVNKNRPELKAAILAHHFIGNWDTREANTLLSIVHMGKYRYRISCVFSDLGTSLGVNQQNMPPDFKVGLVNELPWEVVIRKNNRIMFTNRVNAILPAYENATYEDLLWMAKKIAQLDEYNLRKIIKKAHWPEPIAELYFHKMASRRASIIIAFNLEDPHPIPFNKNLNISEDGIEVIKNGQLKIDYKLISNPESFLNKKGRLRNYGN